MPVSDSNKWKVFALEQLRKSILDSLNQGKIKLILDFFNEVESFKSEEFQFELRAQLSSAFMKELACEKPDALKHTDQYLPEAINFLKANANNPFTEESIAKILGLNSQDQLLKAKSFLRKRKGKSFGK